MRNQTQTMHMNAGNGQSSYANNSLLQKTALLKAWPVVENALKDMSNTDAFMECFRIADLGCSTGPNSLLVISSIIEKVLELCRQHGWKVPEFQVSLNDLPDNDFNTLFRSLAPFYEKLKKEKGDVFGPCFVSGVPGSFYQRLFPSRSLHLIHSSYSLHWLSQAPERLENKGYIYIAMTSPPEVSEAYLKRFERDFSTFLHLRSEEMIQNGHMVLTFLGRNTADPTNKDCCYFWELLAKSLHELAAEGLVEEGDIDSFNLPYYTPYKDEVKAIVEKEGSFSLDKLEVLEVDCSTNDNGGEKCLALDTNITSLKYAADCLRAVTEPMLACHFGASIIDSLFEKYTKHIAEHLVAKKTKVFNIVISLRKK